MDFGTTVIPTVEDTMPSEEVAYMDKQQKRMETMVRDQKWIPILEAMNARVDYYKSMAWVDANQSNEDIGQNAKVGAIVISELEGILNEVRAVAGTIGDDRPKPAKKRTANTKR